MKKLFTALATLTLIAAPVQARHLWVGNGTSTTKTDRFTGTVTTTYNAKKGDCGVTRSTKSTIASCTDMTVGGKRQIILGTTSKGWEVMYYRSASNDKANVILTHKDGTKENAVLPAGYNGMTVRGSTVVEYVTIKDVPATVVSAEIQYGAVEYWYAPKGL